MKKYTLQFIALILITNFLCACGDMNKKEKFGDGLIYYKAPVTKEEVRKLGEFLMAERIIKEDIIVFQLLKDEDVYYFRPMVEKNVEKDPKNIEVFKQLAGDISQKILGNKEVIVQLCNSKFKTVFQIPFSPLPQKVQVGKTDVYFESSISQNELSRMNGYLSKQGFIGEKKSSILITKQFDKYILKFVVNPKYYEDSTTLASFSMLGKLMTKHLDQDVEIHICDKYFKTIQSCKN